MSYAPLSDPTWAPALLKMSAIACLEHANGSCEKTHLGLFAKTKRNTLKAINNVCMAKRGPLIHDSST